ncbi:LacI family transcriptional regulator [Bacilli bacterium]|nr:LacI family transcriptional regulator [Bacilli bacterium]
MTIKDVAKHAGVSVTTVSRVLNSRGSLSQKTIQKVHDSMRDLNYFPNQMAVNLFKKRSMQVGVILPDISHHFYGMEIKYIEEHLYHAGYKLMLCNAGESQEREKEYLVMLQRNKVDGIIIGSHTLHLEEYGRVNLPIIALDRYLGKNIPTISSDHEQGGLMVAQELLRCGCKKVAQVKGMGAVPTPSNKRHKIFKKVMEEQGITCLDYELPLNAFRFTEYLDFVHDIFINDPDIDGFFAADNVACAACKIAWSLNIKVPEQLKIVGYDGTDLSLMNNLSLSTVVQPLRKIAQCTVDMLLFMISGKTPPKNDVHIKLPVTFIRRDTTN